MAKAVLDMHVADTTHGLCCCNRLGSLKDTALTYKTRTFAGVLCMSIPVAAKAERA